VRRAAVRRLVRHISPGDPEDARSTRAAEALDTLSAQGWWGRLEDQLLKAIWHQHAAAEVLYDADWTPNGFRAIEPERYHVDEALQIGLYRDLQNPSETDLVALTPGTFVHHTHLAVAGQPGRYAAVRTAAKLWYLAHLNLTGWGKLIDRWGQPFTHFEYDANTMGEAELRSVIDSYLQLADEMCVATPQGVSVNLQKPVEQLHNREFAEWYAKAMSRFLLGQETAQHATAGQETGATVQGQVRDDLRDEDAEALDDTLATQLIAPWCAWHFGSGVAPPQLRHVPESILDQEQRGRVFAAAQQLGLPIQRAQVYEELGIQMPAPGDELLVSPQAQSVPDAEDADDVSFVKRMLELLASGQMTREVVSNHLDIAAMLASVGLPQSADAKGGNADPWLPIVAPMGQTVTGAVIRDDEGDIVGGDVEDAPAGGGFGGLPFTRLAAEHPTLCKRIPGGFAVRPRALLQHIAAGGTTAGARAPSVPRPLKQAFERRWETLRTLLEDDPEIRQADDSRRLVVLQQRLPALLQKLAATDDGMDGTLEEVVLGAHAAG